MILVLFPAWTPLPGQMHLPNLCIPISLWGLTGPSEDSDPAAPHTQEAAKPALVVEASPPGITKQDFMGLSWGQTFFPISAAAAPL